MASHAGDVYNAASWFQKRQEGMAGFHGLVIVAVQRGPGKVGVCSGLAMDGIGCYKHQLTESVKGNARIIDDEVDALAVFLFEMVCERLHALTIGDVQLIELDVRGASISLEGLCLLELGVFVKGFQSSLASLLIASREINQERSILQVRIRVLKG